MGRGSSYLRLRRRRRSRRRLEQSVGSASRVRERTQAGLHGLPFPLPILCSWALEQTGFSGRQAALIRVTLKAVMGEASR